MRKSFLEENLENLGIGPTGKMEITPEMAEAWGISPDEIKYGEFVAGKPQINYDEVRLSSIERRPITAEEYEALPAYSKCGVKNLLDLGYFFLVVVLAALTVLVVINPGLEEYGLTGKLIVCGIALIILIPSTFFTIRKGLSRKSKIAVGTVLFKSANKRSGGSFHYYLTVAFSEGRYVKKVECYRSSFRKIANGSKVYIRGSRAYAAKETKQ